MFKPLALAAALAASATVAAADSSYIVDFDQNREATSVIDLQTVLANGNGVVEIYDFHAGETGVLLGTEAVSAGANSDVRVNLGAQPTRDVVAVLKVNGQIADTLEIDLQ